MGSTGGITGGGPPKPKPPPIPIAAPTPAKANAPSMPVAPTATSPIAEVPSGLTTPACSPKFSVTSPVGFGQLRVSIFPVGSMIAVLTSPFPLGGVQHRWLRPSASVGCCSSLPRRECRQRRQLANVSQHCCRAALRCGAPDRSSRARRVACAGTVAFAVRQGLLNCHAAAGSKSRTRSERRCGHGRADQCARDNPKGSGRSVCRRTASDDRLPSSPDSHRRSRLRRSGRGLRGNRASGPSTCEQC